MSSQGKRKGREAERELAEVLTRAGFEALRNERNSGGGEDLTHTVPGVWIEACRAERVSLPEKYRQAQKATDGRAPVVVHRYSRAPWMVYTSLDYQLSLWQILRYTLAKEQE